ncbi:protein kinase domain-containing protein [Pedobacter nyackensis]|uniref:protein kinase domain-containing protein n=1 Tax=Pedobacter nyackensis TaxID=475255 RepID=UPI00292D7AD8|nr:protein kinase [Pedobacter nyackensis]
MINSNNPFATFSDEQISAAHALVGKTLASGWFVREKVVAKPGSTGSHFSICYLVEKDGQVGFLKALNILKFLNDERSDFATAMSDMLQTFNFERELLTRCASKKLSKVSKLLDAGEEVIPGHFVSRVLYLIFEKADGDVRSYINFSEEIDIIWKLSSLHNIAVGLKQLHSIDISHQDLKPSNVFLFDKTVSKVGDLGRSLCKTYDGPHSGLNFSGDRGYAPPDYFFGYMLPNWEDRVLSVDLYLLGSMISYYFTGSSMTSLLFRNVNSGVDLSTFKNFDEALPYLIEAFDKSLIIFEESVDSLPFKFELVELLRILCYPCPTKRGYHLNNSTPIKYNFEKIVTRLDVIAKKSEYLIKE